MKAIIIHAWESAPSEHWYRQEEKLLQDKGYEVLLPKMPGGRWPKLREWTKVIAELNPDEKTVFICHSLGPAAVFRYLEESRRKVGKIICIAGFAQDLGYDETKNFVDKPFDWELIKQKTNKIISIAQKHDPYVPVSVSKEIADKTGGTFIVVDGDNHFDKMDLELINKYL